MNPPKPKSPRTSRRFRWLLPAVFVVLVMLAGGGAIFGWQRFVRAYAPMEERWSQCRICGRQREERWIWKQKTRNAITATEHSRWIDSFVPEHAHFWSVSSSAARTRWFGGKMWACGGDPTLHEIYRQRGALGEAGARKLVLNYAHWTTRKHTHEEYKELRDFTKLVTTDPQAALAWSPGNAEPVPQP